MINQIDRVIGDLIMQAQLFKRHGGSPICVALVGINHANEYTSYEGDRAFPTNGKKYKHPIQEAVDAEERLVTQAQSAFDEFLILRFSASNTVPFPFVWKDFKALQ